MAIKAVVFDMGGVIVKLAPLTEVLAGVDLAHDELMERWILSKAVRLFEAGQCDIDEFADTLIDEFTLPYDRPTLIERFAAFPQGLFDGAVDMVAAVRERCVTGILSNTNEFHWGSQPHHEIVESLFDREYLSCRIGLVKPDAAIYEYVIDDLELAPEQILFLDDNQINVDGALAVGMRSAVARGPVEATAVLTDFGVLAT